MPPQNLLFITEFEQVIGLMLNDEELKPHIGSEVAHSNRLTLPSELPTGEIAEKFKIQRTGKGTNVKKGVIAAFSSTMWTMYLKYIEADKAPLEINISCRKRRKIQNVFAKEMDTSMIQSILILMESAVCFV